MYCNITIIGNLVKDAELKYSQDQLAIVTDAIAYTTGFGDKKETSFIDFVIFGKLGESIQQYLTKGSKVLISGELKQNQYVDQQGNKKYRYVVHVKDIRLLGSSNNNDNRNTQQTQNAETFEDEIPF